MSEYPHFALFNQRGDQLLLNACHFYNGATLGVRTADLPGLDTEHYSDDPRTPLLHEGARIYAGVAREHEYIVGDAHGYLRAFGEDGREHWQHHLGSTLCAMDISADGRTLVAASYAGFISLIALDSGRPDWQIGTGEHAEVRRWLFWKGWTSRWPGKQFAPASSRGKRARGEPEPAPSGLQRGHVDHEAILHIANDHPLIGLVDVADIEHLDIAADAMLGAEIQHFLSLGDTANQRTRQHPALHHQIGRMQRWLDRLDQADQNVHAIEGQRFQVGVEIVLYRNGVEQEVKTPAAARICSGSVDTIT